jgi:hypothetical protein
MTQLDRIEWFLFRALWIIMWMILRGKADRDDEARILKWRHAYYDAGGALIEEPKDERARS